ncbi:hypothetical protein QFZ63_001371 [Streptomyces sp. B3I7]|nr:hypothetical protein [Streptomyces sp. B3I7]
MTPPPGRRDLSYGSARADPEETTAGSGPTGAGVRLLVSYRVPDLDHSPGSCTASGHAGSGRAEGGHGLIS